MLLLTSCELDTADDERDVIDDNIASIQDGDTSEDIASTLDDELPLVSDSAAISAQAASITGISDQNLGVWSTTTMTLFNETGIGQVRYNTAWDVAQHDAVNCGKDNIKCARFNELVTWYNRADTLGLKMLVSFQETPDCESCSNPSSRTYRTAVHAFRLRFPKVTEFTAWNEPNRVRDGSRLRAGSPQTAIGAAHYWNELHAECKIPVAGKTCVVAAGDILDSGAFRRYTAKYRSFLNATPTVWAIHPYSAVNSGNFRNVIDWVHNYTQHRTVWYSEVGAFYCTPADIAPGGLEGSDPTAALKYQDTHARLLKSLLKMSPSRVHRTYYYFLAKPGIEEESCPGFDTALLGRDNTRRPAYNTLFPRSGSSK